ncbi:ABC transporter substrate-binding protein [Atopomonas sediminilitoris]|uniref:ABC transporter substrate-binding protein n=1 Tax=Atopomonas sediminilitoris TaxID=2919919 RepID=UPI001F4E9BD5|nr:ABC transporter substrate-binding protein [Atopomonas sediminilitoris]
MLSVFNRLQGLLCGLCFLCAVALPAAAAPIKVSFLNPGASHELFWLSVSQFMQAAADDLDLSLTVHYAERDHARMIAQAREVLAQADPPDYLVIVNEAFAGPELLRLSQERGVKVFMLLNSLTDTQRQQLGTARERFPNWIGALVPDNVVAGRLMATRLIEQARARGWPAPIELLALGGDNRTPAALEREQGLHEALAQAADVRLKQLVYARWDRGMAKRKTLLLLKRHPDARLIWAANDQMAFGALDAIDQWPSTERGQFLVSALNNSDEAFTARIDDDFAVLLGGHFTAGGWAMVMLYDYAHGHDFAERGGVEQRHALFSEISPDMARQLKGQLKPQGFAAVDFKVLTATQNPALKAYDFSLKHLLP